MSRTVRPDDMGKLLTVRCVCGCGNQWIGEIINYVYGLKANTPDDDATDHDQICIRTGPYETRWALIPYCEVVEDVD